jgi:hypothetical protein
MIERLCKLVILVAQRFATTLLEAAPESCSLVG